MPWLNSNFLTLCRLNHEVPSPAGRNQPGNIISDLLLTTLITTDKEVSLNSNNIIKFIAASIKKKKLAKTVKLAK